MVAKIDHDNPATFPWNAPLTDRWFSIPRYHPEHERLWRSSALFDVTYASRRAYKSELHKRRTVGRGMMRNRGRRKVGLAAPTRDQAKALWWADMKALIPKWLLGSRPREDELKITLRYGTEIQVVGLDRPERIEGQIWDEFIVDEIDNCKAQLWDEHLWPAMQSEGRECLVSTFGVPEGRYLLYRLVNEAKEDDSGQSAAYWWEAEGVIDPAIIERAKAKMDPATYNREFRASFDLIGNRAYYTYNSHVHEHDLTYDPSRDLIFSFDFNVDPGVAVVGQEQSKAWYKEQHGVNLPETLSDSFTAWIGEVWIEKGSTTPMVCGKLAEDWKHHQKDVLLYGDATGGARGTRSDQSDWQIIKDYLKPAFGGRLRDRVPRANPAVRDRLNAVRSRFQTADGKIHSLVDPKKARHLAEDFEAVQIVSGSAGEIDKATDNMLSHPSDSAGYYIHEKHPVGGHVSVTEIF